MSVLVKGWDIPRDGCLGCPFRENRYCTRCGKSVVEYANRSERPSYCPLVEVLAPHGRLIDGDEMKELWTGCTFKGDITAVITARPTVIEAEE